MNYIPRCGTLFAVAICISFVGVSFVCSHAVAQRRSTGPAQGDIIKYEHVTSGLAYALVLGSDSRAMNVEAVQRDGVIDSERVPFAFVKNIEVIDSLKSNKEAKPRRWKSEDGKFEILATLVDVRDDKARLKKENGKIISVPLDKLSQKDRDLIEKGDGSAASGNPANPFAGEEVDDYPQEVLLLIERRDELMEDQKRHERLTRRNPNLQIGDIIKYDSFTEGQKFGIVTGFNGGPTVESVDRRGDLEPDISFNSRRAWFLFDRQEEPLLTRTWSSSNGKFKIEAKLNGFENGELSLLKPDGSTLNVPLSKLGNADKKYVAKNKSKLDAVVDDDLVAARESYDEDVQRLLERRGQVMDLASANRVAAVDVSNMKNISLNTKPITLPTERLIPLSYGTQSLSLNCRIDAGKMARAETVCYSEAAGLIAFIAASPFGGKATLALVHAETGEVITNNDDDSIEGDSANVLAISPSGKTLLTVTSKSIFDQQLEYWKHEDGELVRVGVVSAGKRRSPKAHLFNDELGVVLNNDGAMVFVEMGDRIKPTHIVQSGDRFSITQFQISQDQKSVFYFGFGGSSLHIIDVESRKCVGGMKLGQPEMTMFTTAQVTPDGREVFQIERQKISRYDLSSGDLVAQQTLQSQNLADAAHGGFPFISPQLVRLFDRSIYDLRLGVKIGRVDGIEFGQRFLSNKTSITIKADSMGRSGTGGSLFGGGGESRGEFGGGGIGGGRTRRGRRSGVAGDADSRTPMNFSISLEHLDLDEIIEFSNSLSADDIVEFGEGDTVQLQINVGDATVENQLRNKIAVLMSAGGIDVVDKSDFVLKLTYSVGKSRTETYNIIGGMKPRQRTVTFTPKSCSAVLTYRGEKLWSRGTSAGSGRPFDEADLDRSLEASRNITARKLLDFKYPNQLREIPPSKRKEFSWR